MDEKLMETGPSTEQLIVVKQLPVIEERLRRKTMKKIKWIAEKIEEELRDAEEYARAAHHYKEADQELSRCCASLAEEELKHSDKLHREAVRAIQEHKDAGHEAPASMQAVWDWEHEKMIDHTARIRHMLALLNR